jgi:tetratricopeptide (TPR) repeat protein
LFRSQSPLRRKLMVGVVAGLLAPLFIVKTDTIRDMEHQQKRFASWQQFNFEARVMRDRGALMSASDMNAAAFVMAPYIEESRLNGLAYPGKTFLSRALEMADSVGGDTTGCSQAYDRALLYFADEDYLQAERLLNGCVDRGFPISRVYAEPSEPLYYLARIALARGDSLGALRYLSRALQRSPGDPWALSYLSALTGNPAYNALVARYFSDVDAAFFAGKAFMATRRYKEASDSFLKVTRIVPEYRDGLLYLGIAQGQSGDTDSAIRSIMTALQRQPEPLWGEQAVLSIARRHAELHSNDEHAVAFLAAVLNAFGHYDEARTLYEGLLKRNTSITGIERQIEWLQEAGRSYRQG